MFAGAILDIPNPARPAENPKFVSHVVIHGCGLQLIDFAALATRGTHKPA